MGVGGHARRLPAEQHRLAGVSRGRLTQSLFSTQSNHERESIQAEGSVDLLFGRGRRRVEGHTNAVQSDRN